MSGMNHSMQMTTSNALHKKRMVMLYMDGQMLQHPLVKKHSSIVIYNL
jgi:hypothetical protein